MNFYSLGAEEAWGTFVKVALNSAALTPPQIPSVKPLRPFVDELAGKPVPGAAQAKQLQAAGGAQLTNQISSAMAQPTQGRNVYASIAAFMKKSDYADRAAKLWEHFQPAQAPTAARVAGGVAGGGIGAALGGVTGGSLGAMTSGHTTPGILAGTVLGGARGAGMGTYAVDKVHRMLTQRARAGAIRKWAPGVGVAVGATALAAGLAHHFLTRGEDQ